MGGCLAIRAGQRLGPGDSVLVFAAGKPERWMRISAVVIGDSAKRIFDQRGFDAVYSDHALWNRIGCCWGLGVRADPPALSIARYETPDSSGEELPLGIQGLPASAQSLGGDGRPVGPQELGAFERRIAASVPKAFARGKLLRVGRRYGADPDGGLIELLLGKPAENASGTGAPIDSIEICRLYLRQGRVLSVERFSRASGREEHVDVEPPQLDEKNWYLTAEETLGFLSLDGGATWDRISVDVGFEGISWAISRLAQGVPRLWEFYLYTYH